MNRRAAANWAIGIVIVLILVLCASDRGQYTLGRTEGIRAAADGLRYRVHTVHANPSAAAETMAELNRRSVELMRHLRDKYLRGPLAGRSPARARAVERLLRLYNPDNLAENSPRDPDGDTSYTVDKGAILALCLREKNPAGHRLHDLETLTFVTLHELTHIAVEDLDHPPRFWQAFKFVLEEAVEAGLLRGVDYGRRPTAYCGMDIDYNPYFDRELQALI